MSVEGTAVGPPKSMRLGIFQPWWSGEGPNFWEKSPEKPTQTPTDTAAAAEPAETTPTSAATPTPVAAVSHASVHEAAAAATSAAGVPVAAKAMDHADHKHTVHALPPPIPALQPPAANMLQDLKLCEHEDDRDPDYMIPHPSEGAEYEPYDLQSHCFTRHPKARFGSPRLAPIRYYAKGEIVSLLFRKKRNGPRMRGYARVVEIKDEPDDLSGESIVVVNWFYTVNDVHRLMLEAKRHDDLESLGVSAGTLFESDHQDGVRYDDILCRKRRNFTPRYKLFMPQADGGELRIQPLFDPAADAVTAQKFNTVESNYRDFLCSGRRKAAGTTFYATLKTMIERRIMNTARNDQLGALVRQFGTFFTKHVGKRPGAFEFYRSKLLVGVCKVCDTTQRGIIYKIGADGFTIGRSCCYESVRAILNVFKRVQQDWADVNSHNRTASEAARQYNTLDALMFGGIDARRPRPADQASASRTRHARSASPNPKFTSRERSRSRSPPIPTAASPSDDISESDDEGDDEASRSSGSGDDDVSDD